MWFSLLYLVFPSSDLGQADLLVVQLVFPEELLHHEGDALHAGDGVALVVEVDQVPGLPAQRQEEANTLRAGCQHIQILERNGRVRNRYLGLDIRNI